jgi:hypothetical protein
MHLATLAAAIIEAELPPEKRIAITLYCSGVVDGGSVLLPQKAKPYDVEKFLNDYVVFKPYLGKMRDRILKYYKELRGSKIEDLLPFCIDEYDWWEMQEPIQC